MSVAAPEASTNTDGSSLEEDPPDSPPETARYRNLYIVLLVCGFILRFLLSARKFATSPSTSFACSVSVHPFPRTLDRPPGSLPFILNLAALVFRLFGMYSGGLRDRAAWHSVHHRRHRHHHPRSGPPPAGCANRILHGVPAHLGLSFSTWDEQVEQDRAPPFFLHLIELARASHCEITKPSSISLPRRRPRLQVTCRLDRRKYPTGRKVSKEEMKGINLQLDGFHANGTISSDLISPEVVKGWRLVDTFIYLRSLSSYGSVVRPTGTLQNDAGAKGQGSRTPWLL